MWSPLRAWLVATLFFVDLTPCPAQESARQEPAANVVFLHWNDFHGQFRPQVATWKARSGSAERVLPRIGGAAAMAGFVLREREAHAKDGVSVVVTDGGDWFQGTLEGNESKGMLAVRFLNRLAPDATVLGNHDYDFGADNLRRIAAAAKFPVLGANVLRSGAPARELCDYVRPFQVVPVQGLKLVIVGLITSDTKAVSTGPWGDAEFEDEQKALAVVLPLAHQAGDVVVLLTHCGLETDRALAKAFPDIPLILGGHSHTGLVKPYVEGKTWIVQTHGKSSEIYRIEAHVDAATKHLDLLQGKLVELDPASNPEDPETVAFLASETKDIADQWDRVIGELVAPVGEERGAQSTLAGNLVCDAFRTAANAELAFSNKGGIRTRLLPGPVTPRHLYELLPFENNLVSLDLTGAQIRAILQLSLGKDRRPLEIGGGSYRYTEENGERRIVGVTVAGAAIEDARIYRVATSSFLARGGDGLTTFAEGTKLKDHGILLRDVLIQQVEREGTLRPDPANRIVFEEAAKR